MTLFFIIYYYSRRDFFTPTTTERPMFFQRSRVATYSYAYFFCFTYVMIQSAFVFCTYGFSRRIRILVDFAYVSIGGSFVTLWRIRILFVLVRIHSLLVYLWRVATYSYKLLDARMIHVRMASSDVYLYTSSRPYFFTARSFLCVRMDHCDILIYSFSRTYFFTAPSSCVRIFLHAYSSSSVCFLASLFSADIAIAVSLSSSLWNSLRILCSTFVATPPPF